MRLIDADALDEKLQALAERYAKQGRIEVSKDFSFVATVIAAAPTIEAEPVKHGRWTILDECSNAGAYCSVCHKKVYKECYGNCKMRSAYCPNCGAKMDGGVDNGSD